MTAIAEPFNTYVASSADAKVIPLRPAAEPRRMDAAAPAPDEDVDPLRDIALASARLERLQWEMDAVEEELCAALRKATSHSVSAAALARAAGVTLPELESYLQRPAWESDAAAPLFPITGF